MKTKKIRGGFWNYFRRDYSEEEEQLFLIIKKIHEILICKHNSLKQIFINIEDYLALLEVIEDEIKQNFNENKVLYAFLILEKRQLRELGINLNKKLKSIHGKHATIFVGNLKLPPNINEDNLDVTINSLTIWQRIEPIIEKFCSVKNFYSFYDKFYNYIRKYKLTLSKNSIKQITDLFKEIYKTILLYNSNDSQGIPDGNSYDNPDGNSYDNSYDNSDGNSYSELYDEYDKLPDGSSVEGGKRTIKRSGKKSRKIKYHLKV